MTRLVSRLVSAGALLALLAAVLALYLPTWNTPFQFDDFPALKNNSHIRQLSPLTLPLTSPPESPLAGRPICSLSFALNHAATGFDLRSWHATNTLLHFANAALIFLLIKHLLLAARAPTEKTPAAPTLLAFSVALVWAIHPLGSETVIYLTQRTELLVTHFYLATLLAALCGVSAQTPRARKIWLTFSVIFCALGMASKEVMFSAPLVVLLLLAAISPRDASMPRRIQRIFASHSWFWGALAATWFILVFLMVSAPRGVSAGWGRGIGAMEYLFTQAGILVHYLKLCFWPTSLSVIHDWPLASGFGDVSWKFALLAILFLACAVGTWRGSIAAIAGLTAFLVLAPSSSIVPVVSEIMAERRMYLPSAIVLALVVIGLSRAWESLRKKIEHASFKLPHEALVASALALSAAVFFFNLAVHRARDWDSAEKLWRSAWTIYPEHPGILYSLGQICRNNGRFPEGAGFHFQSARRVLSGRWRMYGRFTDPMEALSQYFREREQPALAAAWLRTAMPMRPYRPQIPRDLARLLQAAGDMQNAQETMRSAIEIALNPLTRPESRPTPVELSIWRCERANMLLSLARPDDAWRELEAATRDDPANFRAYALRARMQAAQRWFDQAEASYRKAIELNPEAAFLRTELEAMRAEAAGKPR